MKNDARKVMNMMNETRERGPVLYTLRVDVEPDDITHEQAREQLTRELSTALVKGMQISGVREPVYGLDENGNRVIVAYESLIWRPKEHVPSHRDQGLFMVESGVAIPL